MLSILEASRIWKISRTTIYNKIKSGELSKSPEGKIDPAEMSRVFGSPTRKSEYTEHVQLNTNVHNWTLEKQLLEQKIEQQKQLYELMTQRAERAEAREERLLRQITNLTDTLKLLEGPKFEPQATRKKKRFLFFN